MYLTARKCIFVAAIHWLQIEEEAAARARAIEAQILEAETKATQQALAQAASSSDFEVAGLQSRMDASNQARDELQVCDCCS
jgi:hypothetical protein